MNSRYLMMSSALFMAATGLSLTFAPEEILHRFHSDATNWEQALAQLCGALYCGFALMNWMAKGVLLGGIYGRPLVIGNLAHFTMGAFLLLKQIIAPGDGPVLWALFAAYALFAVSFGYVMMTHPARTNTGS